jgi:hypothetical protein
MDSFEESNLITTDVEFSYRDKIVQGTFRSHSGWKEVTLHICLTDSKKGEPTSVFTFASFDKPVSDKPPEFSLMEPDGDYGLRGPAALIVIGGYTIVRVNSNAFDSHKDHWNFLVSEEFQTRLMKEKEKKAASSSAGQGPVRLLVEARDSGDEGDDESVVGDNDDCTGDGSEPADTGDAISRRSVDVVEKSSHQFQSPASTIASGPAA